MSEMPLALDPVEMSIAGAQVLRAHPEIIEVTSPSPEALRICIKARPREQQKIMIAMLAGAATCLLIGWSLHQFDWAPDLGPIAQRGLLFFALAPLFVCLGALHWLLAKVNPPRDVFLEIHRGLLKIERTAGGHQLVKEYTADRIRRVVFEAGTVAVYTPMGNINLAMFLPGEICAALVAVISVGLWQDRAMLLPHLGVGGMTFPLVGCPAEPDRSNSTR